MLNFFKKKHYHIIKQIICVDKAEDDSKVKSLQDQLDERGYDAVVTKLPIMGVWTSEATQSFNQKESSE